MRRLALALVALSLTGCTPGDVPAVARVVVDAAKVACILAHPTADEAALAALCGLLASEVALVRAGRAEARRQASLADGGAPCGGPP